MRLKNQNVNEDGSLMLKYDALTEVEAKEEPKKEPKAEIKEESKVEKVDKPKRGRPKKGDK